MISEPLTTEELDALRHMIRCVWFLVATAQSPGNHEVLLHYSEEVANIATDILAEVHKPKSPIPTPRGAEKSAVTRRQRR